MSVLPGLERLAHALAARRVAALALGSAAALAIGVALAALAAALGLLAHARWVPLLLWLGVPAMLAAAVRRGRRRAPGGVRALREAAALVEKERALRRGSVVGLVDLASGATAGTSAALAARAERRVAQALPEGHPSRWAPASLGAAGRLVRLRAAALAAALATAGAALWLAGDAAAALASPLRAWRAATHPRLLLRTSAGAVRPGQPVTVTVRAEAGTQRVSLFLRTRGERWRPVLLDADPGGGATHTLATLRGTTWLFASAAGAVSDTQMVRLITPLVAGDLEFTARYPAYLGRQDESLEPVEGVLAAPVGTVLEVRGAASAALERAALASPGDTVNLRVRGELFEGRLAVRGSAEWRLLIAARDGAVPDDTAAVALVAVPDSAPVVAVPVPGADTTAPLDLRAAIVVDARDDHGLGRIEVASWRVSRLGVVGDTVVDSLPGVAGADRVVLGHLLDLTDRGLLPGDTVRYFVRATDRAPTPRTGRSREYALRLRSMAELREAARLGADSLARQAAGLASDQTAVTRAAEDLAAQRDRASDRAAPRQADASAAGEMPPEGRHDFDQQAEAQQLLERQRALMERADSLRTELQRLARAAEEAGLNDPQWQERLRDLDSLLGQALTPELRRSLEELRRALERLDPGAVQEALRRMTEHQRALRDELQRSAELFERAAIEGSLETFAQQAAVLEREQREWADRAPLRRDSSAAAGEEDRLSAGADTLATRLEELARRLERRGDSAAAGAVDGAGRQVGEAEQAMQRAADAMRRGERAEAGEEGGRAADLLRGPQRDLEETRREVAARWRSEVLRMLARSTQETIQLAMEEQRLAREVRSGAAGSGEARGRQSAAEQGIAQVIRQLQESAGRHALVSPRLGAALGQARQMVAQSREALEGPSPSPDDAAQRAERAAQLLSSAAMQMMRSGEDVAGAQSGSGFAEAVQRLSQLAGQMGQLNDQLGGLLPLLGSGDELVMQQLRQLAERQRRLAAELERLGAAGLPGRPERMAEEARQLADRMESGRLDRATLERQQRLFRRLLDAGRTLRNEDEPEDPERRSRTARQAPPLAVPGGSRPAALRYPVPSWEALRALAPAERALVLEYFRRLNAREP